jgi:hypothetical protein
MRPQQDVACLVLGAILSAGAWAPATESLPGRRLARHPSLYCGQRDTAPSAWAAVRLRNGNTLISGNQQGYVREVDAAGATVWELLKDDLQGIPLDTVREASRLANGNTVICNRVGGVKPPDGPSVVQVIEVTPQKRVVWALQGWTDPDLGLASSIQLRDEP